MKGNVQSPCTICGREGRDDGCDVPEEKTPDKIDEFCDILSR